jgi:hypothetical protein
VRTSRLDKPLAAVETPKAAPPFQVNALRQPRLTAGESAGVDDGAFGLVAIPVSLPLAYLGMGRLLYQLDWNWDAADVAIRKAIFLEVGNAEAFMAGYLATTLGCFDEGIELLKSVLALDPLQPWNYIATGFATNRTGGLMQRETDNGYRHCGLALLDRSCVLRAERNGSSVHLAGPRLPSTRRWAAVDIKGELQLKEHRVGPAVQSSHTQTEASRVDAGFA